MYGAYEIGRNITRKGIADFQRSQGLVPDGFLGPRTRAAISKSKYETLAKKIAHKLAHKKHAAKPSREDWVKAKAHVDGCLARKGIAVSGQSSLIGVTDIMGAAYVLGAAAKGSPAAKAAIAKTVVAARKGSPSAKKNLKSLQIAKAAGKRVKGAGAGKRSLVRSSTIQMGPRSHGPFARYFRGVAASNKR